MRTTDPDSATKHDQQMEAEDDTEAAAEEAEEETEKVRVNAEARENRAVVSTKNAKGTRRGKVRVKVC